MPEEPTAESAHAESSETSPAEHRKESLSVPSGRAPSQLPAYLALVIAVVAAALAALAYFHPAHHGASGPAQQSGDAKANVCSAYGATRKGVVINTHLRNPDNNPITELAVAANARLALVGGGAFLQQRVAENTAAPADLNAAVSALANTMQQLGVAYLAGATAESLDPLRHDLDNEINQAAKACS